MSRIHPVDTIGNEIATVLRAARSTYVPPQKLVEYDEFWQYPATKAKVDARLPGTFVQLQEGAIDTIQAGYQGGTVRYRINHVFPLSDDGNYPTQGTGAIRKTLEIFSADDDFDLGIDSAGFEVQGCRPVDFGLSDELMEFGLAWAFVTLEIVYTSLTS